MRTSSNGNIFRVTVPLYGKFTGPPVVHTRSQKVPKQWDWVLKLSYPSLIQMHYRWNFTAIKQLQTHYLTDEGFHEIWCSGISLLNSLALGRFQSKYMYVIFKLILMHGGWGISYEIALRWIPLDLGDKLTDLIDDKSALVQVMAWCHQAPSHYLSQCWPRSTSPNGIIKPQWVNRGLRNSPRLRWVMTWGANFL